MVAMDGMGEERPTVVFDLFGTLAPTPTDAEVRKALELTAEAAGVRFADLSDSWERTADRRDSGSDGSLELYFSSVLPGCNARAASQTWASATQPWAARVVPNAVQSLQMLRDVGFRVVICSDAGYEVPAAFARGELAARVDRAVFSAEFGARKPDPSFMCAAAAGGRVIAFVGDGGSDELAGAVRLGWDSWQVYQIFADGTRRWRENTGSVGGELMDVCAEIAHTCI
jgi:FMN phosphatase YigB (HAD superfamily)